MTAQWGDDSSSPPLFLRRSLVFLSLLTLQPSLLCVGLQVIGGSNLPIPRSRKALDPFVKVEIHGIPSDSSKQSTHAVKNNCKYSLGLCDVET